MEDIISRLTDATMSSSKDTASGWQQVPVHPVGAKLTTFPMLEDIVFHLVSQASPPPFFSKESEGDSAVPGRSGCFYG